MYAEMKEACEPVVYSDVVRHSGALDCAYNPMYCLW